MSNYKSLGAEEPRPRPQLQPVTAQEIQDEVERRRNPFLRRMTQLQLNAAERSGLNLEQRMVRLERMIEGAFPDGNKRPPTMEELQAKLDAITALDVMQALQAQRQQEFQEEMRDYNLSENPQPCYRSNTAGLTSDERLANLERIIKKAFPQAFCEEDDPPRKRSLSMAAPTSVVSSVFSEFYKTRR